MVNREALKCSCLNYTVCLSFVPHHIDPWALLRKCVTDGHVWV